MEASLNTNERIPIYFVTKSSKTFLLLKPFVLYSPADCSGKDKIIEEESEEKKGGIAKWQKNVILEKKKTRSKCWGC